MSPLMAVMLTGSTGLVVTLMLLYVGYRWSTVLPYLRRAALRVRVAVKHVAGGIRWAWWYAVQAVGYHVFHCVRTTDGFWMRYDRDFNNRNQDLDFVDNRWLTSLPPKVVCDSLTILRCHRLTRLPRWLHSDGRVVLSYCPGISLMPEHIQATRVNIRGSWGVHTMAYDPGGGYAVLDPGGDGYTDRDRDKVFRRVIGCKTLKELSVMALSPNSTWLESAVAKGRLDVLSYNDY